MAERSVLVLATRNRDKVSEMQRLFADLPLDGLRCALDFPDLEEVEETGTTLAENALLKARAVAEATGLMSVADDTGLFVDALEGAPGIYAARYAGEGCTYADNREKLLRELASIPSPRRARFKTAMALVDPRGEDGASEHLVEGVLEGEILSEMRGEGGFGYDPVFYLPAEGRTLAEMAIEEKNKISHRAQAAAAMHQYLRGYLAKTSQRGARGSA
jgi:XTP/dITP diphosphohydrolase